MRIFVAAIVLHCVCPLSRIFSKVINVWLWFIITCVSQNLKLDASSCMLPAYVHDSKLSVHSHWRLHHGPFRCHLTTITNHVHGRSLLQSSLFCVCLHCEPLQFVSGCGISRIKAPVVCYLAMRKLVIINHATLY